MTNDILRHNLDKLNLKDSLKKELLAYCPEGRVKLEVKGREFQMYADNHPLYETDNPIEHVAMDVQRLQGDSQQDYVVYFGFAFGLHVEFLRKRFDCPIIVFEPDFEVLHTSLSARPFNLSDVYVETNFGRLMDTLDYLTRRSDRQIVAASMRRCRELYPVQMARFEKIVQQSVDNFAIQVNTLAKGLEWLTHATKHLPFALSNPSPMLLEQYCSGVPGIFVGAGPSLEKNMDQLKRAKGKAVIIAANSALKPLAKAGITPDIVTIIEAHPLQRHFDGVACLEQIVVAPSLNANSCFYELPAKGLMPMVLRPSPVNDWLSTAYPGFKSVVGAGSVALVAFSLLWSIGCDPIVAVGMDLAYTGDKLHIEGTLEGTDDKRLAGLSGGRLQFDQKTKTYFMMYAQSTEASTAPDSYRGNERQVEQCLAWGGEDAVNTDAVFNSYRMWLESAADTWAGDRVLYNCTEGGARIEGFIEKNLCSVVDNYMGKACDVSEWLDTILGDYSPMDTASLKRTIEREIGICQEIESLARECRKLAGLAQKHIRSGALGKAQKNLQALEKSEKALGERTKDSRALVQISESAAVKLRIGKTEDRSDDELKQTVQALGRSEKLFAEILKGARALDNICNEAISKAFTLDDPSNSRV